MWVADIALIPTGEGGSTSRRSRTCSTGESSAGRWPRTSGGAGDRRARDARREQTTAPGLVHNSGHGSQFTSFAIGRGLRESGILPSIRAVGTAHDNVVVESFS